MRCLSSHLFTIGLFSLFLSLINKVCCNAVFQLQLRRYINAGDRDIEGNCCSGFQDKSGRCSEKCLVNFRVCLNVYQANIDPSGPCEFGEKVTPVFANNDIDFSANSKLDDLKFELDTWQGTFSLIIEAWHQNPNSTYGPDRTLVSRLQMQKYLGVGHSWTEGLSPSAHSELGFRYRVICEKHYHGESCRTFCNPRDDTFGHFSCDENGQKVCLPGWEGIESYCDKPICESCKGTCTGPNECKCSDGWEGPNCDRCKVYPGCIHGTCEKAYDCNCTTGWGGLFCNVDLNYCTNHKPCKNGATCLNTGVTSSYSCQCLPGFSGKNCEVVNDTCSNSPCTNGGTCIDTGSDGFVCQCKSGFSGTFCEQTSVTCDDRPCRNGASCSDTPNGFKCRCPRGYEGPTCDKLRETCQTFVCANGGSCVDDGERPRCLCPLGYSGTRCHSALDCLRLPCANGGTCLGKRKGCSCVPGWGGKFCTVEVTVSPCDQNPCDNGGACREAPELAVGYRCLCPQGMFGPRCTVIHSKTAQLSEDIPMSTLQIVVIVLFSVAVPVLAAVSYVTIVCLRRKRRLERVRHDAEVRRQNELNDGNNKNLARSGMIFNSLDYPHKPLNIDSSTPSLPPGKDPDAPSPRKKSVENAYCVAPARSTKTLNIDASRQSLASRLEKELDHCAYLKSSSDMGGGGTGVSKTPEPYIEGLHCYSDPYGKRSASADGSTSVCTTPSSVYIIDVNEDENYIATQV